VTASTHSLPAGQPLRWTRVPTSDRFGWGQQGVDDHRLGVAGGLHRSGTTPLARTLAAHPQVSGFAGTGAREDEGQHLQTVYPRVRDYGGARHFALPPPPPPTEDTPTGTPGAARAPVS